MSENDNQNANCSAEFMAALQRGTESNVDPRLVSLPDRLVASYYIARAFFSDRYKFFGRTGYDFIAECTADRDSQISLYQLKLPNYDSQRSAIQEDILVLWRAWNELERQMREARSDRYKLNSQLQGQPYVKDDPRIAYLPKHMIELFNKGFELSEERSMTWERAGEFHKLEAIYRNETNYENSDLFNAWAEITIKVYALEDKHTALSKLLPTKTLSADTPESEYPQPIWDLYHKAFKILKDRETVEQPLTDADVKTILDLFQQTGFTSAPRTWAGLLADIYESQNHRFTDYGKARELRVQTALRINGEVEAFGLAQSYFNPPPGVAIDNRRAVYWLTIAATQFDRARDLAIQMINYHQELAPLRPHLAALVSGMNYDLTDPNELRTDAGHFLARAHNAGLYGLPMDQAKAQAYYHAVATRDVDWSPNVHPSALKVAKREAALAAATRSLLRIGTNFDPDAAATYAEALCDACDPHDITHSNERYAAMRIVHLVKTAIDGDQSARPEMEDVLRIVDAIIAKRITPARLIYEIKSGHTATNDLLEGCLWLLNTYLENESVGYPSYGRCIAQLQLQLLGHAKAQSVENQFRYNAVDTAHRPILGAFEVPSANGAAVHGFGRFRGLSVTAAGEINFAFDPTSSKQLPLIVPEDIEVALALAFGDDKPIWPGFSAEPPAPLTPSSPKWIPFTAQWEPKWLGHTALGNTLFATDCEAGPLLLWRIGHAQVADDQGRSSSLARLRSIVGKMSDVEDRASGRTNFLTFKVASVELTWSQTEHSTPRCAVNNAVVGLQTGTIDERDSRTYTNNKDFATGYRAALVNANYDLFAEHYPLLERYRQLATLVTALNQLRERGFEPAPPIRAAITESYNSYVRRPAPVQSSQLFY